LKAAGLPEVDANGATQFRNNLVEAQASDPNLTEQGLGRIRRLDVAQATGALTPQEAADIRKSVGAGDPDPARNKALEDKAIDDETKALYGQGRFADAADLRRRLATSDAIYDGLKQQQDAQDAAAAAQQKLLQSTNDQMTAALGKLDANDPTAAKFKDDNVRGDYVKRLAASEAANNETSPTMPDFLKASGLSDQQVTDLTARQAQLAGDASTKAKSSFGDAAASLNGDANYKGDKIDPAKVAEAQKLSDAWPQPAAPPADNTAAITAATTADKLATASTGLGADGGRLKDQAAKDAYLQALIAHEKADPNWAADTKTGGPRPQDFMAASGLTDQQIAAVSDADAGKAATAKAALADADKAKLDEAQKLYDAWAKPAAPPPATLDAKVLKAFNDVGITNPDDVNKAAKAFSDSGLTKPEDISYFAGNLKTIHAANPSADLQPMDYLHACGLAKDNNHDYTKYNATPDQIAKAGPSANVFTLTEDNALLHMGYTADNIAKARAATASNGKSLLANLQQINAGVDVTTKQYNADSAYVDNAVIAEKLYNNLKAQGIKI
jgi:hypothetical protein